MKYKGWDKVAIASIAKVAPPEDLSEALKSLGWRKQELKGDLDLWFRLSRQKTVSEAAFYIKGKIVETLDQRHRDIFLNARADGIHKNGGNVLFGDIARGRAKEGRSNGYLFGDNVRQARHIETNKRCVERLEKRNSAGLPTPSA